MTNVLLYVIIKNSKKLILGVNRVMNGAFSTSINSIKKIFLNKGKENLIGRYEEVFSDDNELNQKILEMLNNKTNGEKYFNNLVCILELLDFLHTLELLDSLHTEETQYKCINFIGESNKDKLIEAIKNFVPKENDHMVVLEDKDGNRFETPGIQICASFSVFEDKKFVLSCSPDNTCRTADVYNEQYRIKELDLDSTPEEFFSSLQDMVHQIKWIRELENIGITSWNIRELFSFEPENLYNNARILTENDKNEIQFVSVAVRGKGNDDRQGIDNEKHDLLSLLNKKLPFFSKGLSRYRIEKSTDPAINYLFDKVSYDLDSPEKEGVKNNSSVMNPSGKKLTWRVLKLLLNERDNKVVIKGHDIIVEENICVDRKFNSANDRILTYIKIYNSERRKEVEVYVDKCIDNLEKKKKKNIWSMLGFGSDSDDKKPKIDREIDEMIKRICDQAKENNDLQDMDIFIFLVKTAVKKRFKYYFSGIKGDKRNNESVINKIKDEYNRHKDDFFSSIKNELMSGLIGRSLSIGKKHFDYEKADLKESVKLNNFENQFDEFKSGMKSVFGDKLPETKEEFEKTFENVNCDDLIEFMKSKMGIDGIDKDFLKNVLSGFLYTYIESIYGSVGQTDPQKFLSATRSDFFSDYLGSVFIKQLEQYLRNICNEDEKMLPDYFYNYDSDRSKNCDEPFSPLNYIQTFLYAPLFPDKIFNMSAYSCKKLARNIEKIRNIIESGSDAKFNQLYEKMRRMRNKNPKLTYPEILLDILLQGVNVNLTQKEKLDICRAARDFTNNNLDQNIKAHVTQSNLVKIKKGNEFYKKKSGIVVIPAVNIFANGTFNKLLSRNIWNEKYTLSLAYYCDIGWSYLWSYETIGLRILFRICLVLFFVPLILFHGISYVIYFCKVGYAYKVENDEDYVKKFKDPKTISKGMEEYNKLQEWKRKIKKENTNDNIVIESKQNNLIKIDSGVKNDINNKIDDNIIDTSSNQKNFSPISGSNDDLNQIDEY